jgi:hypothetical protein
MTAGFLVTLLEGFEGTLDAAPEQIEEGELRREVEVLQVHTAKQRQKFEEQEAKVLLTSVP